MIGILEALGGLINLGTGVVKGWQDRQTLRAESRARIEEARTRAEESRLTRIANGEMDWNKSAVDQMGTSWKDEYILILFSVPMTISFIPGLTPYVAGGFAVLEATPDWYKAAWGVIVAASYGYSKYADWLMRKNSGTTDPDPGLIARIDTLEARLATLENR